MTWVDWVDSRLGQGPDLVGVVGSARPDLHDGAIVQGAVGEVKAESCLGSHSVSVCRKERVGRTYLGS